jgi:trimeric autotransporter adhesin
VGAIRADPWHGASGVVSRAGVVYVFVRNAGVWTQQARLQPRASAADDLVGISLALQGDTLVFGAANDSSVATHSGAAYVFTRSAGAWHELQTLKQAKPVREAVFGSAMAIDGETLAITAPYDSTGAAAAGSVDVFVRKDDKWVEQQTLRAGAPSVNAVFGESVALRGDTLVVGAPHSDLILSLPHGEVDTFERSGTHWTQSGVMTAPFPRDNDYFGASLGLTATALLVGANGDSSGAHGLNGDASRSDAQYEGAAYLFSRQDNSFTQSAYLKAMNAEHDDCFGEFVALSDDAIVVTSIYESGAVGGINGDQTSNGASKSGAVYVFR